VGLFYNAPEPTRGPTQSPVPNILVIGQRGVDSVGQTLPPPIDKANRR